MTDTPVLDLNAVRRQFARRVDRLAQADFLLRETEQRMLDRMDLIRLAPARIVDVGAGLGHGTASLQRRYPDATVLGVDLAWPLSARATRLHGAAGRASLGVWLRRWVGSTRDATSPVFATADAAALPLPTSSVDLLWSNLVWHWFVDPLAVIAEWRRVLRPGGLLMFSTFGVDTLRGLRAIGAALPAFADMHDIGDALSHAGFAQPVMDSDRLDVSWRDAGTALAELSALGGNARVDRRQGLCGRSARDRWLRALAGLASPNGQIELGFDLVFGHAWCPDRKPRADGAVPVAFMPRAPRRREI